MNKNALFSSFFFYSMHLYSLFFFNIIKMLSSLRLSHTHFSTYLTKTSFYNSRVQLQSRGITCSASCPLCDEALENSWYIFFNCPHSIKSWEDVNLWNQIDPLLQLAKSFSSFILSLLRRIDSSKLPLFLMTMWSIWHGRNEKMQELLH